MWKKTLLSLIFVIIGFVPSSFALENIGIGVKVGGEFAYNNFVALDASGGSFGFSGAFFVDFFRSQTSSIALGVYAGLFRNTKKEYDLFESGNKVGELTEKNTFHAITLELLWKNSFSSEGIFHYGIGFGPTLYTSAKQKITGEINGQAYDEVFKGNMGFGLNVIFDLSWVFPLGYMDEHFFHFGLRLDYDLLSVAKKFFALSKNSMHSTVSAGLMLGYTYKLSIGGSSGW